MAIFGFGKHKHEGEHEKDHIRNILIVGFSIFFLGMFAYGIASGQITFEGKLQVGDVWNLFAAAMFGLLGYVMGKAVARHEGHEAKPSDTPNGAGGAKQ